MRAETISTDDEVKKWLQPMETMGGKGRAQSLPGRCALGWPTGRFLCETQGYVDFPGHCDKKLIN